MLSTPRRLRLLSSCLRIRSGDRPLSPPGARKRPRPFVRAAFARSSVAPQFPGDRMCRARAGTSPMSLYLCGRLAEFCPATDLVGRHDRRRCSVALVRHQIEIHLLGARWDVPLMLSAQDLGGLPDLVREEIAHCD